MEIKNEDGLNYLNKIKNNTLDLILTDPPYIISRDTGMNKFTDEVAKIEKSGN